MIESSVLHIEKIGLSVRVGCLPIEKENPQDVEIDIKIQHKAVPKGAYSDDLEDTLCYQSLLDELEYCCAEKHYDLIEHMAAILYKRLKGFLGAKDKLLIKLKKTNPPINLKSDGVSYTYGDHI